MASQDPTLSKTQGDPRGGNRGICKSFAKLTILFFKKVKFRGRIRNGFNELAILLILHRAREREKMTQVAYSSFFLETRSTFLQFLDNRKKRLLRLDPPVLKPWRREKFGKMLTRENYCGFGCFFEKRNREPLRILLAPSNATLLAFKTQNPSLDPSSALAAEGELGSRLGFWPIAKVVSGKQRRI